MSDETLTAEERAFLRPPHNHSPVTAKLLRLYDAALARAEAAEQRTQRLMDACDGIRGTLTSTESRLAAAELKLAEASDVECAEPAAPEPSAFARDLMSKVSSVVLEKEPAPAAEMPEGWELDAAHGVAWYPTAHAAKAIAVWNGVTGSLQVTCEGDWPDVPLSVLRALLATQGLRVVSDADWRVLEGASLIHRDMLYRWCRGMADEIDPTLAPFCEAELAKRGAK